MLFVVFFTWSPRAQGFWGRLLEPGSPAALGEELGEGWLVQHSDVLVWGFNFCQRVQGPDTSVLRNQGPKSRIDMVCDP